MRSTASAAMALRDVSRLCARCRVQASQPLPFARPNRLSHSIASSMRSHRASPKSYSNTAFFSSSSAAPASSEPASASSTEPSQTSSASSESPSSSTTQLPPTHYDIFPETLPLGPPPNGHFPINTRALRREFLQLQARHHPDMHPPGPLKARAEATSALINEAYKTLTNPLLRAQYLLSLRGVDVATDETMQVDDPSLLMVVLEAHEEISDAHTEEDLRELREVNDARIRQSEDVLETAFHEDDVLAAKKEAVKLRYWVNIKQSLDNWEEGRPVVLEH
ncbi:fe-s assembly co-chaperone [Trichoderma arundinaceum]|uniref:Fe-s assembly co-chaperone n=1 Tax=Trichoderma arundinaceum TaxID=490622 RepID=A0A395NH36_TRIAR|nr:fe-s assembly co-chaperone [Trichoderma arundinaceum]